VTDGFEIGELLSKDIPTYMFNGRLTQYDYPGNTYDEERWANAIGFACGQCAPDVRPHDNAFHGPQNPNDPEVVNELREFTSESAQFFSLARDLVCKKAQAQDMRSSVQSFHRNSANSSGICSRT